MATAAAKRSYSFFDVPSLYSRDRLRVPSRALERLLVELETTPGVTDCQFIEQEVPYFVGQKERAAVLHFSVSHRDDPRQWGTRVQLVHGTQSESEQAAIHAARRYCEREGLAHRVVLANRPAAGVFELLNRNAAHAWLTRAWRWPSMLLESQVLHKLGAEPLTLSAMARRLDVSELQMRVVFIRCWLRRLVQWDIANQYILHDLPVCGGANG